MIPHEIILGSWTLQTYTTRVHNNRRLLHPYGKKPVGLLIYTPNEVSVHIMRSDRLIKKDPLELKIEQAENYGGYTGVYKIQENIITHYPKISSFVDYLRTPLVRKFKIKNNLLILEYSFHHKGDDIEASSRLIWQKTSP